MLAAMQSQQLATCCGQQTPYFDDDEWKCRSCGRSLSFAARTPAEAGVARLHKEQPPVPTRLPAVIVSCVKCRLEMSAVRLICKGCGEEIVAGGSNEYRLPPHSPPRLLDCRCCKRNLPQFAFYAHPKQPSREFRFARCKACCAQASRARREANPEPLRAANRASSRKYQQERVDGKRPSVQSTLTPEQKETRRLATQRHRARKKGQDVPKQRSGGKVIHVKQVCRISTSCPLRSFCRVEQTG